MIIPIFLFNKKRKQENIESSAKWDNYLHALELRSKLRKDMDDFKLKHNVMGDLKDLIKLGFRSKYITKADCDEMEKGTEYVKY